MFLSLHEVRMQTSIDIFRDLQLRFPQLQTIAKDIEQTGKILVDAFRAGKKLLVCGNGGSSADSDHIVGELMKSFVKERTIEHQLWASLLVIDSERGEKIANMLQGGVPAISLSGTSALATAFSNDVDPFMVYAQQLSVLGLSGDVFLGISTSGNAENVINAAIVAKAKGLTVVGLTGKSGGKLTGYCDVTIRVPETSTFLVQELHLPIYHSLCLYVENELW